jgi:hypothetical protein
VTPAALRQLAALAEARKAQALARLDAALAEDRRLEAEALELALTPSEDLAEPCPAMPLPRHGVRLAWADRKAGLIRARRAALAGEITRLRALAATTLGRHAALKHLGERAETLEDRLRDGRAEREAPPWPGRRGL